MAYNPKINNKFLDNKPVYSETKSPIQTNVSDLNIDVGKEIIELQKRHYGTRDASQALDRSFIELTRTKDSLDIESFFNIYRELFYDLPKTGNNSHTLLINESKNYVKDYVDPKDDIIDELTLKIVNFERESVEIPSEHPIFPNGTAIRVRSANGSLGALGIMQEGRFRLVSNQGSPSPFNQLKRPLGFVDRKGNLLPDNKCFTFVSPQTFNDLPKFTDPLSLSAINENADYNLSVNNFTIPTTNFSEIASLIDTSNLKKEDINFLIRTLNKKIPFDGYTIEDNENTFTWDPVDLTPFNVKGNFQGEIKIKDTKPLSVNSEDPVGNELTNAINVWVEDLGELDISIEDASPTLISSASDTNELRNKLVSLVEDITEGRFVPFIWTTDPNRPNNVKFYWVLRSGSSEDGPFQTSLKNRVNSVISSIDNKNFGPVLALSTI
tara:strand:+ start:105 stop:1421 length:1317 start_codon:yes stop_codon:yes gene_type:complete